MNSKLFGSGSATTSDAGCSSSFPGTRLDFFKFGPRSLRIRVRRSFRIRAVTTKFPNPRAWKFPNLTLQFPNPGGGEFPNPGSGEFPNPRAWKFPNPTLKFPNPTLAGNAVSGVFRLTQAPSPNVQPQPQWFKFS